MANRKVAALLRQAGWIITDKRVEHNLQPLTLIVVAKPKLSHSSINLRSSLSNPRTINSGGRARPGRAGIWCHHAD